MGTSGSSSGSGSTGGVAPINDKCTSPIALTKDQVATGDTTNATNDLALDFTNSCTGQPTGAGDLFYSFTPTVAGRYRFTVEPDPTSDAYLEVAVFDTCPTSTTTTCLSGADNSHGGPQSAIATLAANTTYLVYVGGEFTADVGQFTLLVDDAPPPAVNDLCTAPTALTLGATVTSDTTGVGNEIDLTSNTDCTQTQGPDVYFTFTPTVTGSYIITLTPTSTQDVVLSLLTDCPTTASSCVAYGDLGSGGGKEVVSQTLTANVTYVLDVAGYGPGDFGPFTIQVDVPPANDLCTGAVAITGLTGPGSNATVQGTTVGANYDDANGLICSASGTGGDVYYAVTLTADAHLAATVTASGDAIPFVSVLQGCDAPTDGGTDELGCGQPASQATVNTATVDVYNAKAGTYILAVQNYDSATSPFSLAVDLTAPVLPAANDLCANATALTFTGNSVHATGTTVASNNDYTSTSANLCGGAYSPDVFYTFTTTATKHVTITVTPDLDTYAPVVDLLASCGGTESTCADPDVDSNGDIVPGSPAVIDVPALAAGTYTVAVDGLSGSAGTFTIQIEQQ